MTKVELKINAAPQKPGVYKFLDSKGSILYIGRAVNLKKRLQSYVRKQIDPRIADMVSKAKDVKIYITPSHLEAIILEAVEIKKDWPIYNARDKDNKSFVYLAFTKGDYPRPFIVRQREISKFPNRKDIFGPYQSYYLLRKALKIIRTIFPYSTCQPNSGRPCFESQIGLCPGICTGEIGKHDYQNNIRNLKMFLSGQKKRLVNKLKKENPDLIEALDHIQDVSLILREDINIIGQLNRIEAYDISHLSGRETYGAMAVFIAGQPDTSQYRLFKIRSLAKSDDLRALAEVVARRFKHAEWSRPDLIIIDGGKPQLDFLIKDLGKLNISIPIIGLSKYAGDKLIFTAKTKKQVKELAMNNKRILQAARDEAHRFGRRASRKKRGYCLLNIN